MKRLMNIAGILVLSASLWGCDSQSAVDAQDTAQPSKLSMGKSDASLEATFVNFEFDGMVSVGSCYSPEKRVEEQLLYTIGQLNGDRGVGRIDTLEVTDLNTEVTESGCQITYHARMLVAWALEHSNKTDYELILPRDVRHGAIASLFETHGVSCVKSGAQATSGSFWYYWRPERSNCNLDDALSIRIPVEVSPSPVHTTGKYPEYHKVWEDGALNVVTIFGKVNEGGDDSDTGVKGYKSYVKAVMSLTDDWDQKTEPETFPGEPGVDLPDVTIRGTLPDGRKIKVVALLVDDIKSASYGFYQRYENLTKDVDLLSYNGHSGLGSNIRVLAGKGEWTTGQYSMVFMNGCDTYAYVDSALAKAHADVNPDDPEGTLYLDILMNAMPSYFYTMADSGMTLVKALLDVENPKTYEQIFAGIDSHEMVIVSGEHDNVFVPGFGAVEVTPETLEASWEGMEESAVVDQGDEMFFSTPVLAPGKYQFVLSGTGDADLYIRVGEAPSQALYDCRPYAFGSDEICEVDLNVPTPVYVMLHGWSGPADVTLEGTPVSND